MAGWNRGRWVVVVAGVVLAIAAAATVTAVAAFGGPHAPTVPFAYVANSGDGTVTPVNLTTGRPGAPVKAGRDPEAIAVTPDGATAYVASGCGCSVVTPVNLATDRAGPPVKAGTGLTAIAITPDGKTAYVVAPFQPAVIPVDLTTGRPGAPIRLGAAPSGYAVEGLNPDMIGITPDGKTAYVVDGTYLGALFPVNLATGRRGTPITFGSSTPVAVAIAPDGKTAYVVALAVQPGVDPSFAAATVIPVNLATGRPGTPIKAGTNLAAIAIAPDGRTAYVVQPFNGTVVRINLATGKLETPIETGTNLQAIAITPDGKTAYVADDGDNIGDGTVIPVNLATGHAGTPIKVGRSPDAIAITR
jgi:DNA-binding beta-propeller fold protein YncE